MAYRLAQFSPQILDAENPPEAVEPRYLTLWPKKQGYFDDAPVIQPDYEFSLEAKRRLFTVVSFLDVDSFIPLYNAGIALEPQFTDMNSVVRIAESVGAVFSEYMPHANNAALFSISSATDGLQKAGEAFQQISAELTYWSAIETGIVPPSIIQSIIKFAREWEDVCFEAASGFSVCANTLRDIQDRLRELVTTEQALRVKAHALAEAEIGRLREQIDALTSTGSTLASFSDTFKRWADESRRVARDTLDAVGKGAEKLGKALPAIVGGAAFGGVTALLLYGTLAFGGYYLLTRRR